MADDLNRPTTHTNNGGEEQPVDLETQRFGKQYKSKEEVEKLEGRSLTDAEYEDIKKKYPHTSKPGETPVTPKKDLASFKDKLLKDALIDLKKQKEKAQNAISLKNFDGTRSRRINRSGRDKMRPEIKAECNKIFKKALQNSTFSIRVKAKGICAILEENKFKNQIELYNQTGELITGGTPDAELRAKASQNMFGSKLGTSPYSNLKAFNDAEKYGYMGSKNHKKNFDYERPSQYGNFVFNFKPSIRYRTTYTIGDSLCEYASPQFIDGEYDEYVSVYEGHTQGILSLRGKEDIDMIDVQEATGCRYVESQYHGETTVDDVESLIVPRRAIESGKFDEMYEIYKRKGYAFKLLVEDENGEIVEFVDNSQK